MHVSVILFLVNYNLQSICRVFLFFSFFSFEYHIDCHLGDTF